MARYCRKCGTQLSDDAVFCRNCGTRVSTPEPEPAPKPKAEPAPRQETAAKAAKPKAAYAKKPQEPKPAVKPASASEKPFPVKFLIVLLAAALAFTAFVYPGFLRKKKPNEPTVIYTTPRPSAPTPTPAGTPVPQELNDGEIPEFSGNSAPFAYQAAEGVFVSAQENVFKQDTTVTFTQLSDLPSEFDRVQEEFENRDMFPVMAWEVDAGLADDEVMPGAFEVEMDLEALGIDSAFYPCLSVIRLDDQGQWYEYAAHLNGTKLCYSSSQNSTTMIVICGVVVMYRFGQAVDIVNRNSYFWKRKDYLLRNVETLTCDTPYGSYELQWINSDIDPELAQKTARIAEIEKQCMDEAKDYRNTISLGNKITENTQMMDFYKSLLENNAEYMQLQKEVKLPAVIEFTRECIDTAYDYLGSEAKVRMPTGKVIFLARTDDSGGALGTAQKLNFMTLVSVWPLKAVQNDVARDNYLLTITHELFHVCQERYRLTAPVVNKLTDDVRYDEMVTMVLERDAKEYYQSKGIITTDPPLTDKEYWEDMRVPADSTPEGVSGDEGKTMMMHEGYMLGDFVMYLQEQYPSVYATPHKMMRARSYFTKAAVSAPLSRVFGMTAEEFDLYYRKWVISQRPVLYEKSNQIFNSVNYKRNNVIKVDKGAKYHVDLQSDSPYFVAFNAFQRAVDGIKGILVMDKDFRQVHPNVNILPLDSYVNLNSGAFFEDIKITVIGEIYGNVSTSENKSVGYSLYTLDKTGSVVLSEADDTVTIRLPEPSLVAKAGLIDGYLLDVSANGKSLFQYTVEKDNFGKTLSVSKANLFAYQDDTQSLTVYVTLCEFLKDTKDELHYGIVSDPASITLNTDKVNADTYKDFVVTYDSLCSYSDVNYKDVDGWSYTLSDPPGGSSVTIAGDIVKVNLAGIEWDAYGEQIGSSGYTNITQKRTEMALSGSLYQDYGYRKVYQITNAPNAVSAENSVHVSSYDPRVEEINTVNDVQEIELSGTKLADSTIELNFDDYGELESVKIILFGTKTVTRTQWDTYHDLQEPEVTTRTNDGSITVIMSR